MVSNSFPKRADPIWDFFCLAAFSHMGAPCMVTGISVFAFPWVTLAQARRLKFWPRNQNFPANGDRRIPLWERALHVPIQGVKNHWSPFWNGDHRIETGIEESPYGNGHSPFPYGEWKINDPPFKTGITVWKRGLKSLSAMDGRDRPL